MRIIGGTLRGRRLESPDWAGPRPTSDALRETLFNVLGARVAGSRWLDGYAGSGAVGLEALSRGAAHVTFIDEDVRALRLVTRNLERCGIREGYTIRRVAIGRGRVPDFDEAFSLVFLDPPYTADPGRAIEAARSWLEPGGLLVIEHARKARPPDRSGSLTRVRELAAGQSALSFFRAAAAGESRT